MSVYLHRIYNTSAQPELFKLLFSWKNTDLQSSRIHSGVYKKVQQQQNIILSFHLIGNFFSSAFTGVGYTSEKLHLSLQLEQYLKII